MVDTGAFTDSDLFILGTSKECSQELFQHQIDLQAIFGGKLIIPVHFTIQRFRCFDENELRGLFDDFNTVLTDFQPFPVQSRRIVAVYSEFRHARVLKWHILLSDLIQQLSTATEQLITAHGAKSMLPSRWISDLISALEDIDDMGFHRNLDLIPILDPLFTVEQITIARFTKQDDFEVLLEYPLGAV